MILPNFLCIGSQKAGTTWLESNLRFNQSVWLPPIKEIHYFDYTYGINTGTQIWGKGHVDNALARELRKSSANAEQVQYLEKIKNHVWFTDDWYQSIFDHKDRYNKISGDITPEYSSISQEGIEYAIDYLKYPKIIWIIRDPIDRAISQIKMVLNRSIGPEPLTKRDWSNFVAKVRYTERGNLERFLPLWENIAGKDNILYIPFGNIKSNPLETLGEIEVFLGLDKAEYPSARKIVHKTKRTDLPDWIIASLAREHVTQYNFLTNRFGKEFVSNTI
ncbi:sulfotransferase family protein [Desulfosediminicola flagellatus]|uniref:sulfotransferase family protein n=1 Tax=Desulfosediminicola flagellatus TaxID=2569541 RepID=UPI0010ACD589|nr:sulfotransferase [Desulfosediminicola flagellatus]